MKIRLEYFSNTDALMALRAPEMQVLILNMSNYLREKIKYGELSEEESKIYQNIRDWWYSEINDLNLREVVE